ncbi:MAG: hypothetical protein AAFY53_14810, partial [Pseudomonadota bacterium]
MNSTVSLLLAFALSLVLWGYGAPAIADEGPFLDLDGDGVDDIWYEDLANSFWELQDRNFDGKADWKTQFDFRTSWPLITFVDYDFSG